MLSPGGYDMAWTQNQGYLVDQLNQMTAGTKEHLTFPFPLQENTLHIQPKQDISHSLTDFMFPPQTATKDADRPTRDLLLSYARSPNHANLFNHASMAWNTHHTLTTLSPQPTPMSDTLTSKISASFSSPDSLRTTFIATANAMFGPGFVWLIKSNTAASSGGSGGPYSTTSSDPPPLSILATYIAGSPLPGAHYRRQDTDMNTQNTSSASTSASSLLRAGSFGAQSGSLDSRIGRGGSHHEVLLGVCTWPHFWLRDWGVAGKRGYLEAWWESVDWATVEGNAVFDAPMVNKRKGYVGLPGGLGRRF